MPFGGPAVTLPVVAPPIAMTDESIRRLKRVSVFPRTYCPVDCLTISPDGGMVVSSAHDAALHVHSVTRGTPAGRRPVDVKHFGAGQLAFLPTGPDDLLVGAANGFDDTIRMLSVNTTAVHRSFVGHRGCVTSLAVLPPAGAGGGVGPGGGGGGGGFGAFASASLDGTVRLWDVSSTSPRGLVRGVRGRSAVAYDPSGVVLATAHPDVHPGGGDALTVVRLFDERKADAGPFCTWMVREQGAAAAAAAAATRSPVAAGTTVSPGPAAPLGGGGGGAPARRPPRRRDKPDAPGVRAFAFSPDGRLLLLGTPSGVVLLDAFSGVVLQTLSGATEGTAASFTPDGWRVLLGTASGDVRVWSVGRRRQVARLPGHTRPVGNVQWNPKFAMMASTCHDVVFWAVKPEDVW